MRVINAYMYMYAMNIIVHANTLQVVRAMIRYSTQLTVFHDRDRYDRLLEDEFPG